MMTTVRIVNDDGAVVLAAIEIGECFEWNDQYFLRTGATELRGGVRQVPVLKLRDGGGPIQTEFVHPESTRVFRVKATLLVGE